MTDPTTQHASDVPRRRTAGPIRGAVAVTALVLVAVACTAPTTPPPPTDPLPPVVSRFVAVTRRTEAPVTAVLSWTVSDPNRDALVCRVDVDDDGVFDRTVDPCNNADSVLLGLTDVGEHAFTLEVDDGSTPPVTATATATVTPGPAEPFEISLQLPASMAPEFRQAFEDAAARWQQVIVAGWPSHPLTVPEGFLGWLPGYDGQVDDVLIAAQDTEIDGPGQVLGSAGTLLYRESGGQPIFGIMQFDTADLQRLANQGRLGSVILHEMGHVLGIGGNWILEGRIDDLLTDPKYNGAAGIAAWRELGGSGGVPLEDEGGLGTAFAHWRESIFGIELMTGYSDGDERLSRLSIAAMADRGYGVDLGAADPFVLSALAAGRADGGGEEVGHTDPVAPYPGERLPGT